MTESAPRIAAVLIIKNEAHCVLRALESMRPGVDTWVVLDTGSTDGTQDLLRSYSKEFPGHLFEGPFENFSQARNLLLDIAEPLCDWMVILDGDMAWDGITTLREEICSVPEEIDGLFVKIGDARTYWQVRAFRTGRGWRYKYRTHELAGCPTMRIARSASVALHYGDGGSREGRLERDIRLIRLDLEDNPRDPLSHYYMGGTLLGLDRPREAIRAYRRSLEYQPETNEMTYITRFALAQAFSRAGFPPETVNQAYLECAESRPWRREGLRTLLTRVNNERRFPATVGLWEHFRAFPVRADELMFVEPSAEPLCMFEYARALYSLGRRDEYLTARAAVLAHPETPTPIVELIESQWGAGPG